ncbi:GNAT family acetyltransferase [Bifidobacterium sp. GSD1FS]|uniref:GNAT family acetyltransferase n=2 Tax=Bifidobacterium canis TaxID=2610880 RepID=A0A7K1J542_9BIFI|nr:GNAT family acetyltransferase [Bifidobacterium canis]
MNGTSAGVAAYANRRKLCVAPVACDTIGAMSDSISYRTLQRDDYPALTKMLCDAWHKQTEDINDELGMKLAQIDLEHSLARTTTAEVAVCDDEVVGVVLGRIDSQETRMGLNKHHRNVMRIMGPLFFNKSAHKALQEMLDAEKTNRRMIDQAKKEGHAYDGEIILFLVREDMRGKGIGTHLFNWILDEFKANDVENYFLYTDTGCNYSFYEENGMARREEMPMAPRTPQEDKEVHDEADNIDNHLHALMFDNQVSPANGGVNPLGR